MPRITVSRRIPVPSEMVWSVLANLEGHGQWMRDVRSVDVTSKQKRGVGTRMSVHTVIGPLRTTDVMEVVTWVEGQSIGVLHEGLIGGQGRLSVESDGEGALVTWDETLVFPWWLGGAVVGWLARPVLAGIWRGNLKQLEEYLSCL